MEFKNYVDQVIENELSAELMQRNIILEQNFKNHIHERHGFSMPTIAGALRRMHPKMGLVRRHLTDELKNFYNLDVSGNPVAYLSNK